MEVSCLRVVRWFEKNVDKLIGEQPLSNVDLVILQKLFDVADNNPMCDCYPIKTVEQIKYIKDVAHIVITKQDYDYFLECDAT